MADQKLEHQFWWQEGITQLHPCQKGGLSPLVDMSCNRGGQARHV
jgi:hypothetical protein